MLSPLIGTVVLFIGIVLALSYVSEWLGELCGWVGERTHITSDHVGYTLLAVVWGVPVVALIAVPFLT